MEAVWVVRFVTGYLLIINIVCICELITVVPLIISLSITCIFYQNFMRKKKAPRCQAGGINEEAVYTP